MYSSLHSLILLLSCLHYVQGERILGAYIFQRHGDRTAKANPPTLLTVLGYNEVFITGSYFRRRYLSSSSSLQISGISEHIVNLSHITASAPADTVIRNSATGWLQGLYPPVGTAIETLRDGSIVNSPMNGYQLIPISSVSNAGGGNSENSAWLQSTSRCDRAMSSSSSYLQSSKYESLFNSTTDFYQSLSPVLSSTFNSSQMSYENAYTIWDYLNVAMIHNSSSNFPSAGLVTDDVKQKLRLLASIHEFDLAYNSSEQIRAVAGAILAGEVLSALNETVTSDSSSKLHVQFGAYGTFLSYFGLTELPFADSDFYGLPDYASSMVWELVTNSTDESFPATSEISVRFLFHNGTLDGSIDPVAFPLFGQSSTLLSWSDFVNYTKNFAILSQDQWCQECGNTTGICANTVTTPDGKSDSSASTSTSHRRNPLSLSVAGVIGAMVTLGLIASFGALSLLFNKLRLSSKQAGTSEPAQNFPALPRISEEFRKLDPIRLDWRHPRA
ncbi:hypothetical protein ASPZODRAFT_135147 [Penicilliopsis zonata CBS 506.65]|uniref:3-phytase n=1 Tax=Penicilliopsis zonata CBS 506.65 TaxID=1073090 RepID=A0A1L9SAW7_9EURO|nr:hypothetical protein ASPZODRAFT_135147 [Penicilliopsis zonata CBS 506.65]OJJ44330.1 hypothetical protein ASPZODRAFT_135147 [Penicilliopsis zonata CBS 506.65]